MTSPAKRVPRPPAGGHPLAAVCAATGWKLGKASLTAPGILLCPACATTVTGRATRSGLVEVAAHPPTEAVTCGSCGAAHTRPECPTCGRPTPAADALLHGLVFAGGDEHQ